MTKSLLSKVFATIVVLLTLVSMPVYAEKKQISIITSLHPLTLIAKEIVGDKGGVSITSISSASASEHDYVITPASIKLIEKADIVLYASRYLEPAIYKILTHSNAAAIEVAGLKKATILCYGKALCHNGTIDPHLWLSPNNGKAAAEAIYEGLVRLDPKNRHYYAKNFQDFCNKLSSSIKKLAIQFNNKSLSYIVYHDAYRYFENEFKLTPSVPALETEEYINAQAMRLLSSGKTKVHCLIYGSRADYNNAAMIAKEHKLALLLLDPLGHGATDYSSFILYIASGFLKC